MRDIMIDHFLGFPREMVWDALTDPDQLGAWLMPNDFRPEVGHDFTFRTDPAPGFDGVVQSKVLAVEPPSRLALSWRGGGIDTVVTFDLEDAAGGTRLRLRHEGFHGLSNLMPRLILGGGWKSLIRKKLPGHLAAQRMEAHASPD